jgi:hypothetical protein
MNFYTEFINRDNHLGVRFPTFKIAISLLDFDKKNNFVETGTTRKNKITHPCKFDRGGDGCSTILFGDYVKKYGGHVWTCDICEENIENCKIATEHCNENITYVIDDSINFLQNFNQKIDFLYLDSLDGHVPNCADHQLNEVMSSEDKLHVNSIILLDDIGTKTALSIPYLKSQGWIQIQLSNNPEELCQALFVHKDNLYSYLNT